MPLMLVSGKARVARADARPPSNAMDDSLGPTKDLLDRHYRLGLLERLMEAWRNQEVRRAGGGAAALSGFHFQFLVTLYAGVRRWLELDTNARAKPEIFGELLSDVLTIGADGTIIVAQVKLRQSSQAVRAALDEFWAIVQLARRVVPELVPELTFQIVSRERELANVEATVDRWCPTAPPAASDAVVADFRRRIRTLVTSDPEAETVALLVNSLGAERPLDLIRSWLGRLLGSARSPETLRSVANDIWQDLHDLEAATDHRRIGWAYAWTASDQTPAQVEHGDFLTGQLPSPRDLRTGRFAPRAGVVEPLAVCASEWLQSHPAERDARLRLPVFWIGGRSGSGKSVALLHVLARLHADGHSPILWLGSNFQKLADAVAFGSHLRRPGQTTILALDDPYAPAAQHDAASIWQNATAQLLALRQRDDPSELPVLVTCGPTEQAERLQDDFPDELSLTIYPLPPESAADLEGLREWYRLRTGKDPPPVGDDNVLLVQLFFEWRVGMTLPEFAKRFRARIQAADATLVEWFAQILAINRLYVGYLGQASGLPADAQATVERLRREHHLVENLDDFRPGLWLAHPHLSDAIYSAWFPPGRFAPHRHAHLRTALLDALTHGGDPSRKTAPLWAVIRSLPSPRSDATISERLADYDVPGVLQEVYDGTVRACENRLPVSLLPPWIATQALLPDRALTPSPIEQALAALRPESIGEKGLRLTCHILLSHLDSLPFPDQRARAIDGILTLLETSPEWREWPHVARHVGERAPSDRLWSAVAEWVSRHTFDHLAAWLLELGLRSAENDTQLRATADQLLSQVEDDLAWGDVAQWLLPEARVDEVPAGVMAWIEKHHASMGVRFVLGRLVALGSYRAATLAKAWARVWHREPTANFVLEPLLGGDAPDDEVVNWAREWLRQDHPQAGKIIKRLLEVDGDSEEVSTLARTWIRRHVADDASWSFGWEALWARERGEREAIDLAIEWLKNRGAAHGSWTFVWKPLWEAAPGDAELATLARGWLAAVEPAHGSWQYVWKPLWEAAPGDAELAALGEADQALAAWKAVAEQRNTPEDWCQLSVGFGKSGRCAEAVEAARAAIWLDPYRADAWRSLAMNLTKLGEIDEALAAWKVVAEQRNTPEDWCSRSVTYAKIGRYGDAVEAARAAIWLDPYLADAWRRLAINLDQMGKARAAVEAWKKLDELAGTGSDAKYEAAAVAARRTIEEDPLCDDAWRDLAMNLSRLNRSQEAASIARERLTRQPELCDNILPLVDEIMNQAPGDVVSLLEIFVVINPENAKYWNLLGAARAKVGDFGGSLDACNRATAIVPEFANYWYTLARAYDKGGHGEAAERTYAKVLKLQPNHPKAQAHLRRLQQT